MLKPSFHTNTNGLHWNVVYAASLKLRVVQNDSANPRRNLDRKVSILYLYIFPSHAHYDTTSPQIRIHCHDHAMWPARDELEQHLVGG